jgi:hypothetical protein
MRRAKKTAGITTAMTIPNRPLGTSSAWFLIGYPREDASSLKATAATATTPTRIVGTKGWPGEGAKLLVTFTQHERRLWALGMLVQLRGSRLMGRPGCWSL